MRLLPRSLLGRLFLVSVLLLPLMFALWYHTANVLVMPAVWLSQWLLNLAFPGLIEQVEGLARQLDVVTGIVVPVASAGPGAQGNLVIESNALIYTWNLPVLLALLFAAQERFFTYWRLALTFIGLIPFHAWGISFEVLKVLSLQSGEEARRFLDLAPWQMELVGLAYQFGYLMLPVIGGATLWIAMNRDLLFELLHETDVARA
jgi:hypothetical protein